MTIVFALGYSIGRVEWSSEGKAAMDREKLPEMSAQFKRVLWKRFPKKRKYLLGRSWARDFNFNLGGILVREYCRLLTDSDKVLSNFSVRAPSDMSRERGLDTTAFESERIFRRLWRNRYRGDAALKLILFEEYVAFRDSWMQQHWSRYAPKQRKRLRA